MTSMQNFCFNMTGAVPIDLTQGPPSKKLISQLKTQSANKNKAMTFSVVKEVQQVKLTSSVTGHMPVTSRPVSQSCSSVSAPKVPANKARPKVTARQAHENAHHLPKKPTPAARKRGRPSTTLPKSACKPRAAPISNSVASSCENIKPTSRKARRIIRTSKKTSDPQDQEVVKAVQHKATNRHKSRAQLTNPRTNGSSTQAQRKQQSHTLLVGPPIRDLTSNQVIDDSGRSVIQASEMSQNNNGQDEQSVIAAIVEVPGLNGSTAEVWTEASFSSTVNDPTASIQSVVGLNAPNNEHIEEVSSFDQNCTALSDFHSELSTKSQQIVDTTETRVTEEEQFEEEAQMMAIELKHPLNNRATSSRQAIVWDFENLLELFKQTENVRYEHFAQIWREMKMPFVFAGRQNDRECREFTEDCILEALHFYLHTHNFQTRVGGLYLLYALYNKQVYSPKVKIRVSLDQWRDICRFQEDARSRQHYDVDYIYHWLVQQRAFHFVFNPALPQLRMSGRADMQYNTSFPTNLSKDNSAAPTLVSKISPCIDRLSAIHDQYHRMKCRLVGPDATSPSLSLSVIHADLVQYITKSVTNFEDWTKNKSRGKRRRADSGATTTSESEADSEADLTDSSDQSQRRRKSKTKSVGATRAEIKERAFSMMSPPRRRARRTMQASRQSKRTRQTEATKHEDDEGSVSNNEQKPTDDSVVPGSDDNMEDSSSSPTKQSRGKKQRRKTTRGRRKKH